VSSYIAFELDALNVVPSVAAAAGMRPSDVSHGLLMMWAWCFRESAERVTAVHVRGFFGTDCCDALTAFGFLKPDSDGFVVRGADRYRRVSEARSAGGKKASGNLKRGTQRPTTQPGLEPGDFPGSLPAAAGDQPGNAPGSLPALTPSTEHRAPNTESKAAEKDQPPPKTLALAAFAIEGPDPERMESWSAQEFWKAFELERRANGFPPEKWPAPNSLRDWWTEARGAFDVRVLGMAASNYYRDAHWQQARPPCPWAGFAKQWAKFLPRKAVAS